jgi:MerR family transcriptional regulator/heat shock protein HspR
MPAQPRDRSSHAPEAGSERGVYIISVAAELVGVHPQTLRIYERKGLLQPSRTAGNTRRYSERDIYRLQTIQRLTQEGVNLAGVKMIVEMENQLDLLHRRMEQMHQEIELAERRIREEVERVRREYRGEIVPVSDLRRAERRLQVKMGNVPGDRGATGEAARRRPIVVGPVPARGGPTVAGPAD